MSKVLIVGGGAAGMFASIAAARGGHEVLVFEKNEKLGKKLFNYGEGKMQYYQCMRYGYSIFIGCQQFQVPV